MIQAGYVILTLVIATILIYGYYFGMTKLEVDTSTKIRRISFAALGLLIWLSYVFFISNSGFLQNFDLPPRFPLLLVIPTFLFIAIQFIRNKRSGMYQAIPIRWSVYFQSFRILVESLFLATVGLGILHPEVTFEGYNFDLIFGVSAIVVGLLVYAWSVLPEKLVLYWNYLGLLVLASIVFLFTTTVYFPSFWGKTETWVNPAFLSFPYTLVPAFLMPSAVMIHIFSILQLNKQSQRIT